MYTPSYVSGCCSYAYANVKAFNLAVKAPCAAKTNGILQTVVPDATKRSTSTASVDTVTYCSRCTCPTSSQTCALRDMVPYSSEDRCDSASAFNAVSASTGGVFTENITIDGNQNLQTLNFGDAVAIDGFLEVVNNPYVDVVNLTNLKYVSLHVNISNNADALLRVHAQCSNASDVDFVRDLVPNESHRANSAATYDAYTCYSRRCRCTSYEGNMCQIPTSIGAKYGYCASSNCMQYVNAPYLEPYTSTDVCTHTIVDAAGVFNGTLVLDEDNYQYTGVDGFSRSRTIDRNSFAKLRSVTGDLILAKAAFAMYESSVSANPSSSAESALGNLESIGGDLHITDTSALGGMNTAIKLYNFSSLQTIGGELKITGTASGSYMTQFRASRLTSVGGAVTITNNEAIAKVSFDALTTTGGDVNVANNGALAWFAVPAMTSINGTLTVSATAAGARVRAPCAAESAGFIESTVSSASHRATSSVSGATTLFCVETRCACSTTSTFCYATALEAYSADYVCEDAYDATTGHLNGDIFVDGDANVQSISFSSMTTVSGELRVTNNPSLYEIRLDALTSVGTTLNVTNNGYGSLQGYVSRCVAGAPISYVVSSAYRAQSTFDVDTLYAYDASSLMQQQCFTPPAPPPPPSPPPFPPPARAAIQASISLLGYDATAFGQAQRDAFVLTVAAQLGVSSGAVVITSVTNYTSGAASGKRRLHQISASGVSVAFKVETLDISSATTSIGPALDALMASASSGAAPPLLALLQADANLSSVTGVEAYVPVVYLAPPPSPPPPPPLCGNGALDPGETCDEGFGPGLNQTQRAACDSTCQFDSLYTCSDWTATNCTCSNAAGVFAVEEATEENGAAAGGCAQTRCVAYPNRCLANGAGCVEGSWKTGCIACKLGYYRSGSRCKLCGDNTAASAAVVAVVTVVAGLVGYRAAQILDNTSTALIKGIVSSMQYISINVDVDVKWPDQIVAIGRWFASINFNLDIIAPECVSGSFNWYYIFWIGAVIVPVTLALLLVARQILLKRAYVRTVISIDGDETGYFIRRRSTFTRRELKRFHSLDGSLVIAELQRQYQNRVAVRTFAVLALTVMYLPVVRLCLQSYECIYHGDGYVLEHDTDLACDAPLHRVTQAVASLILLFVGLGTPALVLLRVRQLRLKQTLDGARELTSWGALYDIYRRPIDDVDEDGVDKVESGATATDGVESGDRSATLDRVESLAQAVVPTRFERFGALLAVHYLTVELLQKFIVVVCTSPRAPDVAAALLVCVYAIFAAFVYWTQPWRVITLNVCGYTVKNAFNRVEVLALALQSVLVVLPWAMNGAASAAATALLTLLICGLLFVRMALFVSERLSFLRERKISLEGEDAEVARKQTSSRMLALAMDGDETRLFALRAKVMKTRSRLKARYESTRDAIMHRALAGQGSRAMLTLAKDMMNNAKKLDPMPAPKGTAGTRIRAALKLLDEGAVDFADGKADTRDQASASLELTRMISAHQRALHELMLCAKEYAEAECVPELLRVANEINKVRNSVKALPNKLGEREAADLMLLLSGDSCLGALHRAVAAGDAEVFVGALVTAGGATLKFETWCATESAKLAASAAGVLHDDDDEPSEIESGILRVAQTALATRSMSTTERVRSFIDAWQSLAKEFSTNKWNASIDAVAGYNEELVRATIANDFEATERAFNATHDEVDAFIAWCDACRIHLAKDLGSQTSAHATGQEVTVSSSAGVIEIASLALRTLVKYRDDAKDPNVGIRRIASSGNSNRGSKVERGGRRARGRKARNLGADDALHS